MSKRAMADPVEEEEVRCPVCGEEWEKGEIFCYFCGYEQRDENNPLHPPPVRDSVIVDPDNLLETSSVTAIAERIQKIGTEKNIDISFVGSADMRRIFLLEKLKNKNIAIYGSRWKRNDSLISTALKKKII